MGSDRDNGSTKPLVGSCTCEYAASLDGVQAAAKRIKHHIHQTPVMTCSAIDVSVGRHLFFKCEIFQRTGAFKFRGACNAVQQLSEAQASKGRCFANGCIGSIPIVICSVSCCSLVFKRMT